MRTNRVVASILVTAGVATAHADDEIAAGAPIDAGAPTTVTTPAEAGAAPDAVPRDDGTPDPARGAREYGARGVFEAGATLGLMLASGFRDVNCAPSLGWFAVDNALLTGIVGVSNVKAGASSTTVWSVLAEPSYLYPLQDGISGFVGMALGYAYVSELGSGLAVAPRVGAKLRIGRAGVLTPSLSYEYTTHGIDSNAEDITLVAVSSKVRINIGYTTIW